MKKAIIFVSITEEYNDLKPKALFRDLKKLRKCVSVSKYELLAEFAVIGNDSIIEAVDDFLNICNENQDDNICLYCDAFSLNNFITPMIQKKYPNQIFFKTSVIIF
jgi:hypothetical protein